MVDRSHADFNRLFICKGRLNIGMHKAVSGGTGFAGFSFPKIPFVLVFLSGLIITLEPKNYFQQFLGFPYYAKVCCSNRMFPYDDAAICKLTIEIGRASCRERAEIS